ncbi:uncharacterized protein LOC106134358 [Amyelois transitella]|uniref:uncharacterized protein LOC106134358 n=1 Tax=Amyelois transitella TaxID=680683 RepID=UPI00299080BA|nr:uncharacterized protein LOC106134358 [Amyelois transitella]
MSSDIRTKKPEFIPPENDVDPLETKIVRTGPITPISRHRKKRLRIRTIPTTKSTININEININNLTIRENVTNKAKPLRTKLQAKKWEKHVKKYGNPVEIFYRRDTGLDAQTEAEMRRRHSLLCVDLLRPIITGMKKNATVSKFIGEQVANRLIQLLSSNGKSQTPEDIEAILYQINELQLRFFQWEVTSLKKLFNFIMPGQKHSFKSLKHGVKKIFEKWHMDLSNTQILIKDSRMFRPPCIGTSEGSTRSSLGTRYTKPATPKSTCKPKDTECNKEYDVGY